MEPCAAAASRHRTISGETCADVRASAEGEGFVSVRPGVDVCAGGLDAALDDAGDGPLFVLDAAGDDLRDPSVSLAAASIS